MRGAPNECALLSLITHHDPEIINCVEDAAGKRVGAVDEGSRHRADPDHPGRTSIIICGSHRLSGIVDSFHVGISAPGQQAKFSSRVRLRERAIPACDEHHR